MKSFIVGKNDAGQRLDKFLSKAAPGLPASLLYKGIRQKNIKVSGKRAAPGQKLEEGNVISVYLPDEVLARREHTNFEASAELDIVYEDENILLLNKPQGLLAHQGEGPASGDTLVARVHRYLYQSGGWNPESENSFVPALCHRIDRNTSGLVIAAKTAEALRIISEKLRDRQVTKLYMCIVHGVPKNKVGTLKSYLNKDEALGRVRVEQRPFPGGKTALTKYWVLAQREGKSLVEVQLLTGRTHQIRAQFAAAGHPLWGDAKYGNSRENKLLQNRQALCAYKLIFSFTTPAGPLEYLRGKAFEVPVPFAEDFAGYGL